MELESALNLLREATNSTRPQSGRQTIVKPATSGPGQAELRHLSRRIGVDHSLALQLWQTQQLNAQILATLIADPAEMRPGDATEWMKSIRSLAHQAAVAKVLARTPFGIAKMRQWRKQKSESARATGYRILVSLLGDDADSVDDPECERILRDIVAEIHRSPNGARYAMVLAVIAIGIHKPDLREAALQAGELIGRVRVIHDELAETTPQICAEIQRATGEASPGKTATVKSTRVRA